MTSRLIRTMRGSTRAVLAGTVAAGVLAAGVGTAAAAAPAKPASTATPAAVAAPSSSIRVIELLRAGQKMHNMTLLVSPNHKFLSGLQPDGNFVIYEKINGGLRAVWATATQGHRGAYMHFWSDGGLGVYARGSNRRLWAAHQHGGPARYLVLQNQGNLVLYTAHKKATWGSPVPH